MLQHSLALCAAMLVAGQLQPDYHRLQRDDERYARIVDHVGTWQLAARARDVARLSALTWPEYRESARGMLLDQHSALYRTLLDPDGELQRLLKDGPVESHVFERKSSQAVRSYAVCLAGDSKNQEWPIQFVDLLWIMRAELFCTYWIAEPKGVFISYSFGLPDD